jgi:glycine/D-amino acid oxidase-like deaminating enzyme
LRSHRHPRIEGGVTGVETTRGFIGATKVGVAVAGSSSKVMSHGRPAPADRKPRPSGLRLRGSEADHRPGVITFGAGHFYVSQSDKGGLVFGGDIDGYNSYAQRGNLPVVEDVCEGGMAMMPMIGRARLLRIWGGIMDMSMDGSPIIDRRRSTISISMPAGAMAASRRRPPRAGASRISSPTTPRIPPPPPIGSTGSRRG